MVYRFEPWMRPMLWGGNRLAAFKHLTGDYEHVGESWELSAQQEHISVVAEGPDKGLTLPQLIDKHRERLVGRHVWQQFGTTFPLLVKFIDAQQDLSVQVHPDDATARRAGLPCGKTEMWYVLPSSSGASLCCGFRERLTPDVFRRRVEQGTIMDALARFEVRDGDCFFIPAGRIHTIGAGTMLCEIQQTSDTTYRIYDFNRRDAHGNTRPLHLEQALQALNFSDVVIAANPKDLKDPKDPKDLKDLKYLKDPNHQPPRTLVSCPYFTTNLLEISGSLTRDCRDLDSFVILVCLSGHCNGERLMGNGERLMGNGERDTWHIRQGETVLLPATTEQYTLNGNARLLEVALP